MTELSALNLDRCLAKLFPVVPKTQPLPGKATIATAKVAIWPAYDKMNFSILTVRN